MLIKLPLIEADSRPISNKDQIPPGCYSEREVDITPSGSKHEVHALKVVFSMLVSIFHYSQAHPALKLFQYFGLKISKIPPSSISYIRKHTVVGDIIFLPIKYHFLILTLPFEGTNFKLKAVVSIVWCKHRA
ncbi:hypothetical protein NPIL_581991 [Nephila pilipes]|uniref:Uncharacterized protein n=1 Tax=Nephila pilipes TaxID=299642 RepID=A0A8X6PSA6_NEPPI|nr:hypothetical protein NPIL_581991 [Nephila pilipes]